MGRFTQREARPRERREIRFEVRRARRVDPHDDGLAAGSGLGGSEESGSRRARLGLAILGNGILQIEGDRIGLGGQCLGEQLRARPGNEQFAAHASRATVHDPPRSEIPGRAGPRDRCGERQAEQAAAPHQRAHADDRLEHAEQRHRQHRHARLENFLHREHRRLAGPAFRGRRDAARPQRQRHRAQRLQRREQREARDRDRQRIRESHRDRAEAAAGPRERQRAARTQAIHDPAARQECEQVADRDEAAERAECEVAEPELLREAQRRERTDRGDRDAESARDRDEGQERPQAEAAAIGREGFREGRRPARRRFRVQVEDDREAGGREHDGGGDQHRRVGAERRRGARRGGRRDDRGSRAGRAIHGIREALPPRRHALGQRVVADVDDAAERAEERHQPERATARGETGEREPRAQQRDDAHPAGAEAFRQDAEREDARESAEFARRAQPRPFGVAESEVLGRPQRTDDPEPRLDQDEQSRTGRERAHAPASRASQKECAPSHGPDIGTSAVPLSRP